jgi:hypothetical protein
LPASGIASAVAFFMVADLQPAKILSQGIAHYSGAIATCSLCGLIDGLQKVFVDNDLDDHW